MTSDQVWDPKYADNTIDPADPSFYENTPKLIHRILHVDYNVHGEYVKAFPTDTASDPIPTNTTSDPVSTDTASAPVSTDTASDPVPTDTAANSALRKEQHQPLLSLESNGSALFDDFTAGCIFEDAVADYADQDQLYDAADNQASADFWLNDAEYYHHESVARCVNAALRSNTFHQDEFLDFHSDDSIDDNVYSVHELEFLANGSPRIHTPSAVDYDNMRQYFAWQSTNIIEATFRDSTQYGFMPTSSNGNMFK